MLIGIRCFLLLETIKEFAWNKLVTSGHAFELKERHAHYFLELVEAAAPELTGKDQFFWIGKIEANYDNIRGAILWALEEKNSEVGLRFGTALWRYWLVQNQVEGWDRLQQILSLPVNEELEIYRAKTLSAMGASLNSSNNPRRGRELLEESISIFRTHDKKADLAISLNHLGHSAIQSSDYKRAIDLSNEALAIGESLGLRRVISTSYNNLGFVHIHQCRLELAHKNFTKSAKIRKSIVDTRGYSFILTNLAWTEIKMGAYEEAALKLEEALHIVQEQAVGAHMLNWVWVVMIEHCIALGKWEEAKILLDKTAQLREENVYIAVSTMALVAEAELLIEAKEFRNIKQILDKADAKITAFGSLYAKGSLLATKLRAALQQGHLEEAISTAKTALEIHQETGDCLGLAVVLELIAQLNFKFERYEQSVHALAVAKMLRKRKNLFLPLRFFDQLADLELALHEKNGVPQLIEIENKIEHAFEIEIEKVALSLFK